MFPACRNLGSLKHKENKRVCSNFSLKKNTVVYSRNAYAHSELNFIYLIKQWTLLENGSKYLISISLYANQSYYVQILFPPNIYFWISQFVRAVINGVDICYSVKTFKVIK